MSLKPGVLKTFLIELLIYAVFAVGYVIAVVHLLDVWLKHLYDDDRFLYAVVALALIISQGVLLQLLTSWLVKVINRKKRR